MSPSTSSNRKSISAVGVFLLFGSIVASLSGISLLWPGTALDRMWQLNPSAYAELAPVAKLAGSGFLALGVTLGIAGAGWFGRKLWAWRLVLAVFAIQLVGDFSNFFRGRILGAVVGVSIAAMLLFFISRESVRRAFGDSA
jgi:hypothetical protein